MTVQAEQSVDQQRPRIYRNAGNRELVDLLGGPHTAILDVGCGAGDNAAEIRRRFPGTQIFGITHSEPEAELARRHMTACWVADLEHGLPSEAKQRAFDAVIFSHVLEHLRDPAPIVAQASDLLTTGGACVIAVPNVLAWNQRIKFLSGRFEYEQHGIMDETHLRFFTYRTAVKYLMAKSPALDITHLSVTGAVPLWVLRRAILPKSVSSWIDRLGCRAFPNLFGSQILIKAIKRGS